VPKAALAPACVAPVPPIDVSKFLVSVVNVVEVAAPTVMEITTPPPGTFRPKLDGFAADDVAVANALPLPPYTDQMPMPPRDATV
jgi:hypothetical protein